MLISMDKKSIRGIAHLYRKMTMFWQTELPKRKRILSQYHFLILAVRNFRTLYFCVTVRSINSKRKQKQRACDIL